MSTLKYTNIIVFGASGAVGSLVALEAHNRGAKVWLAMRDTSKPIQNLPADNGFVRVQADLTDPASVKKAVTESGAKAAFVYLVHGSSDSGRGGLEAMRDAGVENVVFLSSFGIRGAEGAALRAFPKSEWIAFLHAQVEIAIEDLGFPHFTALRAAWFASNYLRNYLVRSSAASGQPPKAIIVFEDAYADNIAPEDIGAVGAAVLVAPPASAAGKTTLYLSGAAADALSAKESWEVIKRVSGRKDIETTPTSPEALTQSILAKGYPEVVATDIIQWMESVRGGLTDPQYEVGAANVRKYLGREPMSFVEYLEAHKAEWLDI